MVYDVSDRFRRTISGSHLVAVRTQLLETIQFGAAPTGGTVLPLLGGGLNLSASTDIKGSLRITVPADYWEACQPYGTEIFVERGIDYGDGTRELVPLGYYRIQDVEQTDEPFGPIAVTADDRTATLQDVRVIYPYQVPPATTHRAIFERLVNGTLDGAEDESGTYGMYPSGPDVAIDWDDAGYDPDAVTVASGLTVDDYVYDFLAKLVDSRNAVIAFRPTGELAVIAREPDPDAPAVLTVRPGDGGTLVRQSRRTSRKGVYNIVRATGSDPGFATGYRLAYIADTDSPLFWAGRMGALVRYYASPLLRTTEAAAEAALSILGRSTGLPTERSLWTVPDPSLQPFDKINSIGKDGIPLTHIIDGIDIPLVVDSGSPELQIRTRTTNPVGEVENDPTPPPPPDPEDPPGEDPGSGDPGGGPGGSPDPADGTQQGVLGGWGPVIAGDEFNDDSIDTNLWGLYNSEGHAGNGLRRASAFTQTGGVLRIHGENKVSGGAAFKRSSYGYRVECRVRVYHTGGGTNDRYHPVLILWPSNDQWPAGAEYDYFECDEGTGEFGLFMHLPNHTPYRQDHYSEALDIQNWHNYACEWNPQARTLRTWIDGRLVYNGSGRVADAPFPMHPTFQLDDFGGNPRPCNFEMAWMRIYGKPNGGG